MLWSTSSLMQERAELLAEQAAALDTLLQERAELELKFVDEYLAVCAAYEEELEAMRDTEFKNYAAMRSRFVMACTQHDSLMILTPAASSFLLCRLDGDIAQLELLWGGMGPTHALQADQLEYSHHVLRELPWAPHCSRLIDLCGHLK
jgi:uncharacterized protein YwqG